MQDPFGPPESGNSRLIVGMYADDQDLYRINLTNGAFQGQLLTDPPFGVRRLAYDAASGNLFAISYFGWQVRLSSNQGALWTLVDSFADAAYPSGLVVDNAGNIYVCGNTNAANGSPTWFVRKSSDHGLTWSTVDRLSNAGATGGILFVPGNQGGLFVAGWRSTGVWTVRRSRDAGATWQQVDSFGLSGKGTYAQAMASDARGRIFVAGYSSPDPVRWEVRMSENGGITWKTISPPNATAQINGVPWGIVVDWAGNLLVAGTLDAWAVARRTPDGLWHEPEFPFGAEAGWVPSQASAVTIDTVGNVLVAGRVRSGWPGTIINTMVIQKLAPTVLPPLRIERSDNAVILSWPAAVGGIHLESTSSFDPGTTWAPVPDAPTLGPTEWSVQLPLTGNARFFRLRQP